MVQCVEGGVYIVVHVCEGRSVHSGACVWREGDIEREDKKQLRYLIIIYHFTLRPIRYAHPAYKQETILQHMDVPIHHSM